MILVNECIRGGDTRAGDSIVELENPDPSAVEDVMNGRIIHRIRQLAVSEPVLVRRQWAVDQPGAAGRGWPLTGE